MERNAVYRILYSEVSGFIDADRSRRYKVLLEKWQHSNAKRYLLTWGEQVVSGSGAWVWSDELTELLQNTEPESQHMRTAIKTYDRMVEHGD